MFGADHAELLSHHWLGETIKPRPSDEVFTKYQTMAEAMQAAGRHACLGCKVTHGTEGAAERLLGAGQERVGCRNLQDIVDLCAASYPGLYQRPRQNAGKSSRQNDGLKVALGMYAWTFAAPGRGAVLWLVAYTGKELGLNHKPTPPLDDLYAEGICKKYAGDAGQRSTQPRRQTPGRGPSTVSQAQADFLLPPKRQKDPAAAKRGAETSRAFKRSTNYTVDGADRGLRSARDLYHLRGLPITPMPLLWRTRRQYNYEQKPVRSTRFWRSFADAGQDDPADGRGGPVSVLSNMKNRVCYFTANEKLLQRQNPRPGRCSFKEDRRFGDCPPVSSPARWTIGDLNSSKIEL